MHIFVQVYITECVGVKWVWFSSMCFGASSTAGSLFIGKILSHIPRFVIPILWGFCDSIWNTVTTSKSMSIYWECFNVVLPAHILRFKRF